MRILLTLLFVLGISFPTQASDNFTRLQSLPLGSDTKIHRALTDQVSKVVMNIHTQVSGDVNADGIPLWRVGNEGAESFPFSVENGEIDYEVLHDQFKQFIDQNLKVTESALDTVKFSTRIHLKRWSGAALLGFANEFYLKRNSDGDIIIPAEAYRVEFDKPVFLRIPQTEVAFVKVVYDMYGEDFVAYDSGENDLIQSSFFNIPLDAQREAREFGVPAKVVLTYNDGEVREFDLDTGARIGDPSGGGEVVSKQRSLSIEVLDVGLGVRIVGDPGDTMQVRYSPDMVDWIDLARIVLDDDGNGFHIDDPATRHMDQCFYQAIPY